MTMNKSKYSLLYLVINSFKGLYLNIIGMISITEIFALISYVQNNKFLRKLKSSELKNVRLFFILLLVSQIIAELAVKNNAINIIKSVTVTIMAYLMILFHTKYIISDTRNLKYLPLSTIISLLLWGDQFGFMNDGEVTYFKFYIAPLVANICLYIILSNLSFIKNKIIYITLLASLFIIAGGARSTGFTLLFSALIFFIYQRYKRIRLKKVLPGVIGVAIIFQIFYSQIYIPKVVSGEWGSDQNREQLKLIDNSTNIFKMLYIARTDFFVSFQAFLDKPLFGHGNGARDKDLKYLQLNLKYTNSDRTITKDQKIGYVPVHSVIVGMGTQHGIFKFLIFLVFIIYIYRIGIKALDKKYNEPCINFYIIYTIVNSLQLMLFGPPSLLKTYGAQSFAIFLALYIIKKQRYKNEIKREIQVNHCNSHVQIN